jgi:hypothetical protein
MPYRLSPNARTANRSQRPIFTKPVISPQTHPVLKSQPSTPDCRAIRLLLITMEQALHTMDGLARATLFEQVPTPPQPQLQDHARDVEVAMHRLLELDVLQSELMIELAQSLTTVVLAADLLAGGGLVGADAQNICGLLVRNVQQAQRSVTQLRASNKLLG